MPEYCPYPDFVNGGTCGQVADKTGMCVRHRRNAERLNPALVQAEAEAERIQKGRIKQVSSKQAKTQRQLAKIRKGLEAVDSNCKIQSPVCIGEVQGTHHIVKRSRDNVLKLSNIVLCCNPCNGFIETHSEWAKERGFLVSKFKK